MGLDTLVAYYRMADLALVSSVYDGMNLVAKEYVACQVNEHGVLLVSQMAGAAEELTQALVINPYDHEGVADAIREALEMPPDTRRDRMRGMRAGPSRRKSAVSSSGVGFMRRLPGVTADRTRGPRSHRWRGRMALSGEL